MKYKKIACIALLAFGLGSATLAIADLEDDHEAIHGDDGFTEHSVGGGGAAAPGENHEAIYGDDGFTEHDSGGGLKSPSTPEEDHEAIHGDDGFTEHPDRAN